MLQQSVPQEHLVMLEYNITVLRVALQPIRAPSVFSVLSVLLVIIQICLLVLLIALHALPVRMDSTLQDLSVKLVTPVTTNQVLMQVIVQFVRQERIHWLVHQHAHHVVLANIKVNRVQVSVWHVTLVDSQMSLHHQVVQAVNLVNIKVQQIPLVVLLVQVEHMLHKVVLHLVKIAQVLLSIVLQEQFRQSR